MAKYNFENISEVPQEEDFFEIIRSSFRCPNKAPLPYCRTFYSNKLMKFKKKKDEKLSTIIDDFPGPNDIRPFDGDMLNEADYQIALDRIREPRNLTSNIFTNHAQMVRVDNYGHTYNIYVQCVGEERDALGQACMAVRKTAPSLTFLEETRRRLAMLPCIDPNAGKLHLHLVPEKPSRRVCVDQDIRNMIGKLTERENEHSVMNFMEHMSEREKVDA